jgi:oligosaccharide reducing-end xylanase
MRATSPLGCWLVVAMALPACTTTVDSLGYNRLTGADIHRLTPPGSYPNAFGQRGRSETDINDKINGVFMQLFYGDSNTQAIYFPRTDDAYIKDTLHNDIRTEGVALGMNIAVQLGRQNEFDRLWTYARAFQQIPSGANEGYYTSFCEDTTGAAVACVDPFGYEQFVTALLFANDRWGSNTGAVNYAGEAAKLLNVMRLKLQDNGGVAVDGVTDTFDPATRLAYDVPNVSAAGETRPAVEMPGYYTLWRQATGDPFWTKAAASARTYLQAAASQPVNQSTGLLPVRANFNGSPVASWDTFQPEGYRAQLNMVLDRIWAGGNDWEVGEADRLLTFFTAQGNCKTYTLDGTCLDSTHEPSLVVVNGITAAIATTQERTQFIDDVWSLQTPTGDGRYYAGVLELIGLLILSGRYQVW